jgi:hypothetical protein
MIPSATVVVAAALALVIVHGVAGNEIIINPQAVTSLQAPKQHDHHFTDAARCFISLADGRFVNVVEACDTVREMITQAR